MPKVVASIRFSIPAWMSKPALFSTLFALTVLTAVPADAGGPFDSDPVADPRRLSAGFRLYQARPDKGYSLTDCISMEALRREGVAEVLTNDEHFARDGFTCLLDR